MAAAATVSIIMLLLLLLVLVGFIVGIVLWATGGRSRGGGEMACGGCGYSVRGLEQLNCPECGADLRAVGIAGGGPGGKRLTGILLTSICGFLLLSCCGLFSFSFLATSVSNQSPTVTPLPAPVQTTQPSNPQGTTQDPEPASAVEGDTPDDEEDDADG